MKISVVIIIHKNPSHVEKSLLSIAEFADEIIIGDYQMTAKVPEKIANKVKLIKIKEEVPFADLIKEDFKKNATGDYILYLDPDEILPPKLTIELKGLVGKYDAVYIPRKNIIFDKWIEHSRWWPDYQLRFFKKDAVVWPKTIHPVPEPKGSVYKLPQEEAYAIVHYNYDSITHYLEKAMRYAQYEAKQYINGNETVTLSQAITKGLNEFISRYFASDGYRDGMRGFVLAFLQMFYYFLVYFYYWEKKKYTTSLKDEKPETITRYFAQGLYESNHWLSKKNLLSRKDRLKLSIQNLLLKK